MKWVALERFEHLHIEFSPGEVALLREDKYTLNDAGEVRSSATNYQKFVPNYQFSFSFFAQAHGGKIEFDRQRISDLNALERFAIASLTRSAQSI